MGLLPQLTRGDRAYRREKIVDAYSRGLCSRTVARLFGVSASHVRWIVKQAGASRKVGRPAVAKAERPAHRPTLADRKRALSYTEICLDD